MTTMAKRVVAVVGAIVIAGAVVLIASSGDDDKAADSKPQTTEPTEAPAEPEKPAFAYEGDLGPENWGELSSEYATCADGSAQSPIDLTGATERDVADIGFSYSESALNIFNNGHTIEVEYDEGSSIDLDGTTYDVLQFHFHGASEHVVAGEPFPLELHIVHSTPDGALAVVGVLIETGAENAALAAVFDNIPTEASEEAETVDGATVDLTDVLPASQTYFQYDGSLTTPPCTEGVSWQVLDTPIQISEAQLAAFTDVVEGNFRPVQPLGDRELVHDSATNG